jgi:hypothetical protein
LGLKLGAFQASAIEESYARFGRLTLETKAPNTHWMNIRTCINVVAKTEILPRVRIKTDSVLSQLLMLTELPYNSYVKVMSTLMGSKSLADATNYT